MELKLQPTQSQIKDLLLLCSIRDLEEIANSLCSSKETVLTPADARKELARIANKLSPEEQASLFRQAMGLRGIMTRGEFTAENVMQALTTALAGIDDFNEYFGFWKEHIEKPLQAILESRFIRIVSKSAGLAYDYAYLLGAARIITDARPVFSEVNGIVDGIDGIVVSHVLRLEYENSGNEHTMSIVMDHLDVKRLRDACERALSKAEAVQKQFSACSIPTRITGRDEE